MRTKTKCRLGILKLAAAGSVAALIMQVVPVPVYAAAGSDLYQTYRTRATVSLGVTQYDFTSTQPDFAGTPATGGKGRYEKIAADTLSASGLPVFNSTGYLVTSDWKNSTGQNVIAPRSYINSASGDVTGAMSSTAGGAVTSATTFNQWFQPVAGVNTTYHSTANLAWNGTSYVYDGSLDNFGGKIDYDYTAAINTTFIQDASSPWYIDVGTGAEAFVYIDGKLVIDGGGGMAPDATDPGLPGGHFDVDVYKDNTSKQQMHTHQYDDKYDVTYVDVAKDTALLFKSIIGVNTHPLRVQLINKDNGGWGVFTYADSTTTVENWISIGLDKTFVASDLKQLRFDFRTLALMAHTDPGSAHADAVNHAGAFTAIITDTVTNKVVYEISAYHHGTAPANYATVRADYLAHPNETMDGPKMPGMNQRIDLSRLPWLTDGATHTLKVFYANRTGSPSQFHLETNINTLDLVALPVSSDKD